MLAAAARLMTAKIDVADLTANLAKQAQISRIDITNAVFNRHSLPAAYFDAESKDGGASHKEPSSRITAIHKQWIIHSSIPKLTEKLR